MLFYHFVLILKDKNQQFHNHINSKILYGYINTNTIAFYLIIMIDN